jgi:hypothetical protein
MRALTAILMYLSRRPLAMNPSPFDLFKVLYLIEDATGLRAQISMRELLKPRIAERIADDLIEVF